MPGPQQSAPAGQSQARSKNQRNSCLQVLGSTEQTWGQMLCQEWRALHADEADRLYPAATSRAAAPRSRRWGHSTARPISKSISTPSFFNELSQRFGAPGDFAQAYVIAHEVGHHVQDLEGTLDQAHDLQARSSETEGNAIQVKVELQADCYAGVWAANAKDAQGQPVMEQGDFEEGMRAAEAIGDDTLQRQTQGVVVPDSFTHGTSAQRMEALQRGYKSGDPAPARSF